MTLNVGLSFLSSNKSVLTTVHQKRELLAKVRTAILGITQLCKREDVSLKCKDNSGEGCKTQKESVYAFQPLREKFLFEKQNTFYLATLTSTAQLLKSMTINGFRSEMDPESRVRVLLVDVDGFQLLDVVVARVREKLDRIQDLQNSGSIFELEMKVVNCQERKI